MPSLLSGRVKVSTGTNYTINNYITLSQAQAGLGTTPTGDTGYTLVIGPNGVATFTNTLGQIAFSTGTITSQSPTGDLTLNPAGTGTITLNGPVNIPQGVVGSGFKKEAVAASTGNVTVNTSTSTVVYDGIHLAYLDRLLVRANDNPATNGIYYVSTASFTTGTFTVTNVNASFVQNNPIVTLVTGIADPTWTGGTISGAYIAPGTTVLSVQAPSGFTLSQGAIGSGSDPAVNITYTATTTVTNVITLLRATDAAITKGLNHIVIPVVGGNTYANRLFFTPFTAEGVVEVDPIYWDEVVDSVTTQTIYNKRLENISIGQLIQGPASVTFLTASNLVSFTNATETTATNVGAVTVAGGVGITKGLYVGGATNLQGSLNVLSQANLNPANATVSIQPTGLGTVTIDPSTKGTIDNMDVGNVVPGNGTFVNLTANNELLVTSTAQSTSTTTGAVQVVGGVGINGNLVLGGQLIFSGAAQTFTVNNLTALGQVLFTTSTNSTSTTTGGLVVSGGVGIAQDLVLGGKLIFQGSGTNLSVSTLSVTSSSQSTSTTTGALTVVGGVGVGGNLVLGGQLIFQGAASTLTVAQIYDIGTATSTSTTTGALVVTGGAGIGKDVVIGGNVNIGGSLSFSGAASTLTVAQIYDIGTATSTSTTTGALVVTGGAGIGKDVVIGGNLDLGGALTFNKSFTATFVALHITSTASDTSVFTNNAVYVEGGVAVKKDLSIYGNTLLTGNLTVLGTQTFVDSTTIDIESPVLDLGTGPLNTPLITNDGLDRGLVLHYSTGVGTQFDNHAFVGRDSTTGYLVYKTNVWPGGVENFSPTFASTGSFGTAQFGGLKLVGGLSSISTTTGDLQVKGGIGVNGISYFSSTLNLASPLANSTQTINHALVVSTGGIGVAGDSYFAGQIKFANVTAASSPSVASVVFSGGVGINGSVYTAGPVRIQNATSATSTGTGALVVAGGAGFNGDIYAHRIFTDAGQTLIGNFNGGTITDPLFVNNTTSAYSTTTGALTVTGGTGIGGSLYVGGVVNAANLFVNGAAVLTTATPTGFQGGTIIYPLQIGYSTSTLNTTGLTVNSGVNSLGTDSGAIVTIGGVGIAQDLHVGGTIYREGDITAPNWGNIGIGVNLASATFTDNQGSGSFTNTQMVYVGVPTINSQFGSTYAQAQTIFIEGAPKAKNSNTILRDSYAVWVNDGRVHIASTASSASNYLNNALSVAGGIGIQGSIQASGPLNAPQVFDSGNRVITSVNIQDGAGISSTPDIAYGPTATITISNTGVIQANAGTGINIDFPAGTITISNVGVTSLTPTQGIGFSTSTGSVTLFNLGVTSLTAGTDTAVASTTGNVVIWNTSTLQTVTDRGSVTSNTIRITNTQTGLVVAGDAVFSGTLLVSGSLSVGGAAISGNTATFTTLQAGNTLITGNLTVSGTSTFINSTQTYVVDPVIDIGTGINNTPLQLDDGYDRGLLIHYNTGVTTATDNHAFLGREHATGKLTFRTNIYPGGFENVPNPYSNTGTVAGAIFSDLSLIGGIASTSPTTGDLQVSGGIGVGGASYLGGQTVFGSTLNASSTLTGAVQVQGGQAIGKDLYVGGNVIVRGFVLTTATAYNGGEVFDPVIITNGTSSTNTLTGALIIHNGGAGIGGDVNIGGYINAAQVFQNGQPITTNIKLQTGNGITGTVTTSTGSTIIALSNTGILNIDAGVGININSGTGAVYTITNIGVDSLTISGLGLKASTSTGSVVLSNIGVTANIAGAGIGVSTSTGSVIITNLGVYSIGTIGSGITASTSTGSVFLINSGVTSLTAGTDTAVTAATGDIVVWNTSTLQTVTDRGNITTNQVIVNNTTPSSNTATGALQVIGGAAVGSNLYVGGKIVGLGGYVGLNPWTIFTGTSNATVYDDGVSRHVDFQFANVTATSITPTSVNILSGTASTTPTSGALQVTGGAGIGGNINVGGAVVAPVYYASTGTIKFTDTTTSTNTVTGAVQITGGVAVGNNLYVQGTVFAGGGYLGLNPEKIFMNTSSVTVIDTGTAIQQIYISVAGTTSTQFFKDHVSVNVALNTYDIISTGTITRSGAVTKTAWGSTGVGISVPAATYTDSNSSGIVSSAHINAFGIPTISAGGGVVSYTNAATIYVGGAPTAGNGSTTINNAWAVLIGAGKTKLADTTASNGTQSGALQVVGGVGIGGDVYIGNSLNVVGSTFNLGNSETYTYTSPVLTNSSTVNLDTFATSTYQSAKYFIQVADNTAVGQPNKMYVTELIVYHDGNGQTYISEYGMASNLGDLGTFDAVITGGGNNVQLTWTPNYTPTSMVVKLNRLTLSK